MVVGDQEGVSEDYCQALKTESVHKSCQLQPHHAYQVFVLFQFSQSLLLVLDEVACLISLREAVQYFGVLKVIEF